MAGIVRPQGSKYHNVATFRLSAEFIEYIAAVPLEPGRGTLAGRVLLERKVVQIPYVLADPEYILIEGQRRAGFRTLYSVCHFPMRRSLPLVGLVYWKIQFFVT
jgi:two-component system, NtrC family, sensor kinase